jgi:TatD DNase family protein
MQTISTRLTTFAGILAIAERRPEVYCSIGVHPHQAGEEGIEDPSPVLAHIDHPRVIGIGESGLDYYYDKSPRDIQATSFRAHIAACRESGLPLIVHTRDADEDTIAILEDEMAKGAFTGVIHCYSTSRWLAERAVAMGMYLGLGGILTFNRSEELRETVAAMPIERLILETDAPYLAPVPMRGRPNEPAYTRHVASKLAPLFDLDADSFGDVTSDNFFRLFSKAEDPRQAS